MAVYVLDTFALASYFLGEKSGKKVRDLLKRLKREKKRAFLCELNLGELYYALFRKKDEVVAEEAVEDVKSLPISLVSVDLDLIMEAAKIKAVKPVSFADAFVAAVAKEKKAIVVTSDPEFRLFEKEIEILWL